MELHKPRYKDPFSPVQLSSPPLRVTSEQSNNIRAVLDITCSDTQFADKAYRSIQRILVGGSITPPVVTSLTPTSVVLGAPSFNISVKGTGFTPTSKIIFNGFEEPTTFVSATEVSTGVDMSVWGAPAVVPIMVDNDGVTSNSMNFTFNPSARSSVAPPSIKEEVVKKVMIEHKIDSLKDSPFSPVHKTERSSEK